MKRRDTLIGQILAINVVLVTATIFAASVAAGLDLNISDQRRQFLVLAMAIVLTLAVNLLLLQRRFHPLERLIQRVEAIDPARGQSLEGLEESPAEEVERLTASFRRLLERIEAERRRSGRLVLRAQEEERKRVARDLHDEVNQSLTAILLRLEALGQDAPPGLRQDLEEAKRLANQAMEELLRLARQLRPSVLDDHGLVAALREQLRRFQEHTGIETALNTNGATRTLGDDQQLVIYRVVQEALSNVAHHSGASQVEVDLLRDNGRTELCVCDDGRGFDPRRPRSGLGLNGMSERARLVDGELDIQSAPGRGTRLRLRIP